MSHKNLDNKGRPRSRLIATRLSPAEWELFDMKAKLSGKTKQDFALDCLMGSEIRVHATVRTAFMLRQVVAPLVAELRRLRSLDDFTEEMKEAVIGLEEFTASIEVEESPRVGEDELIKNMARRDAFTVQSISGAPATIASRKEGNLGLF